MVSGKPRERTFEEWLRIASDFEKALANAPKSDNPSMERTLESMRADLRGRADKALSGAYEKGKDKLRQTAFEAGVHAFQQRHQDAEAYAQSVLKEFTRAAEAASDDGTPPDPATLVERLKARLETEKSSREWWKSVR